MTELVSILSQKCSAILYIIPKVTVTLLPLVQLTTLITCTTETQTWSIAEQHASSSRQMLR